MGLTTLHSSGAGGSTVAHKEVALVVRVHSDRLSIPAHSLRTVSVWMLMVVE